MDKWHENGAVIGGAIAVTLLIGGLLGWVVRDQQKPTPSMSNQVRADIDSLKFTNPLLFSKDDNNKSPAFDVLAAKIRQSIASSISNGNADSASIYFRDLNTARWTGVDEEDTYKPSSMLKVVTMIAVLKLAEENPAILTKNLPYKPDESTDFYLPDNDFKAGNYKVTDLINNMIVYSDNASNEALLSDKDINDSFNFTYALFRLPRNASTTSSDPDFMSARSYSSIFRALYNSSFFQWQLSEASLSILSKTNFSAGLVAGVPSGTAVSHKFGEAAFESADKRVKHELHDCGIVYYPEHPYLLCVMTKGDEIAKLESVVASISKMVWEFVGNQNK